MSRLLTRYAAAAFFLASLVSAQASRPAPDASEAECRAHLTTLGNAIAFYMRANGGKLPEHLSALYAEGFVLDVSIFVCPGSGTTIAKPDEIDAKTDYALAPAIGKERPIKLLWEKAARHDGAALEFMSDRTFRRASADTAAEKTKPKEPTKPADDGPAESKPSTPSGVFAPAEWDVNKHADGSGSSISSDGLLLVVVGRKGAEAWQKSHVAGDFDLEVEYAVEEGPSAKFIHSGVGIRLMAKAGNPGLVLDYRREETTDTIEVETTVNGEPETIAADVKGRAGFLRVQRRTNRFELSFRADPSSEWTTLDKLATVLGNELQFGFVAYGVGKGELRALVKRFTLTSKGN